MRVLITGAGRGLGLELVRLHLERKDFVYALAHSVTEELRELAWRDDICIISVEMKDERQVRNAMAEIPEKSLDVIYNVAGIWYEDQMGGIEETDVEKAAELYRVNALGPLCVMKYGKRLLKDGAVLLNVSSEAGSIGRSTRSGDYGYCMSKAALNMAAKLFRNETAAQAIRVYCYHPGWMRTQMGGERAAKSDLSISARESAEALERILFGGEPTVRQSSGGKSEEVLAELSGGESTADVMFFDYEGHEWEW